jgi:putative heme degradation protein
MDELVREYIRRHIAASDLTQRDVAAELGIHESGLSRLLGANGTPVLTPTWARLLEALDLGIVVSPIRGEEAQKEASH